MPRRSSAQPTSTARPRPPRASALQKVLLVLSGAAATVVCLLLIEAILALLGVADDARYEDPYLGFAPGSRLYHLDRGPGGERVWATRPEKIRFFNRQQFRGEKPPGALRIFALGESTTYGHPYDDAVSFARWLERYLDAAEPGRIHEVVNAGGISYASYRIATLMRELVDYSPDVFVVYVGHNEFLEERTYRDVRDQPESLRRLGQLLSRYRLAALLRRGARAMASADDDAELLPDEVKTRLDVWTGLEAYHRDEVLAHRIVEHFDANLERMVEIARDAGAEILFVEPVSNLKDFSPFKSEHRDDLDPAARSKFDALYQRGRKSLDAGDPAAALEALEEARAIDPAYADVHFRIGRARLLRGEVESAQRSFVLAKDEDVAPLRALESELRAIERKAARDDVPLVDLPALLAEDCRRRLGHPILGDEYLLDHVHPDLSVHSLIAEKVLRLLADRGTIEVAPNAFPESKRREIYDSVLAGLDAAYYAQRDLNLGKVLGWAGKLEEAEAPLRRAAAVLDADADLHLTLGTLLSNTGRPDEAAAQLERAAELEPGSAAAHFNLGVAYGKLGRPRDGIAALQRALALQPDYAEARHNLGVLERETGDLEAAIADLRRALEMAPRVAAVHRSLAAALSQAGREQEALEVLRRGLALEPESYGLHLDAGVALARAGHIDEAEAELERAVALDPADAEARYDLAVLLAGAGRIDEAITSYRSAIENDPLRTEAHANLGILLARRGDLESAQLHLERAVALAPTDAVAHLNLGVVLDQRGRAREALEEVERAASLEPGNAEVEVALAMLYLARGRHAEASASYERAVRSGAPIAPEVRARFER